MCDSGDSCQRDDSITRRSFLAGGVGVVVALGANREGEAMANPHGAERQIADNPRPKTRVLDRPEVQHGTVRFQHNGADTGIGGYLARPKADGIYPGVLVIAGNKISEEYIPNTCSALALAGFVGLAPDVFHPLPESSRTPEEYEKYVGKHTEGDRLDDIQAGATYLQTLPFVRRGGAGMSVLGFCRGGREALLFANRSREIDAVVAFHPAPIRAEEVGRLRGTRGSRGVPVQVHHGTKDNSVEVSHSRELEALLKAQKTPVELFLYEGADHGFLAYTRPFYVPDAAKLAWDRTIRFLHRYLD